MRTTEKLVLRKKCHLFKKSREYNFLEFSILKGVSFEISYNTHDWYIFEPTYIFIWIVNRLCSYLVPILYLNLLTWLFGTLEYSLNSWRIELQSIFLCMRPISRLSSNNPQESINLTVWNFSLRPRNKDGIAHFFKWVLGKNPCTNYLGCIVWFRRIIRITIQFL